MDVILRGVDHPHLGMIATRAVDADLAIALTRGRHAKSYAYVDPNEDAVAVRADLQGTVLAVADGHNGVAASHLAVEAALDLRSLQAHTQAVTAMHRVNQQIVEGAPRGRRPYPRTTLAMAVRDEAALTYLAVGDSAVLLVRDGRARPLTRGRPHFLGDDLSETLVAGALEHGSVELAEGDVVLLVTDGYTNFAPVGDLAGIVAGGADAEAIAAGILQRAGDGGAGDNVAAAVLRV